MKLEDAIRAMAPLIQGRASVDDAAGAMRADGATRRGLEVYAEIAEMARTGLLEAMFPHAYEATLKALGPARWAAIVKEFFEKHPETHYVRRLNAGAFVGFSREIDGLPGWIVELVDFEWLEWLAERHNAIAPDAPSGLRLAPSLELRRFEHDLVDWLDNQQKAGEPARRPTVCAFWQDATGQSFRCALSPELAAALEAVRRGESAERALLLELRDAEILVGDE